MAATAKQLAALKKARAARAKNLGKPKAKPKAKAKAKPKAKVSVTNRRDHIIEVKLARGSIGYLTPRGDLDTVIGMAAKLTASNAATKARDYFNTHKSQLTHVKVLPLKK